MGAELTECNNNLRMQPCNIFIVGYSPSCLLVLASGNTPIISPYYIVIYNVYGSYFALTSWDELIWVGSARLGLGSWSGVFPAWQWVWLLTRNLLSILQDCHRRNFKIPPFFFHLHLHVWEHESTQTFETPCIRNIIFRVYHEGDPGCPSQKKLWSKGAKSLISTFRNMALLRHFLRQKFFKSRQ